MKLTPVRVRGKRGQPRPVTKWSAKEEARETTDLSGQPEAKRAKQHHSKATAVSRILQLPQEVLERVFVISKNLSLPLVNRELFRRLSTGSIKYQLVGAAFGTTWHAWYGLDNAQVCSYHGWNTDADRIAGDASFQSTILACSWAKLPVLLASFDIWIRQHACDRTYFTVPKLVEERLRQATEPGSLYDRAYNGMDVGPSDTSRSPNMTMRQKFAFDLQSFQDFVATQRLHARTNPATTGGQIYSQAQDYLRALLGMHLEVQPGAAIPNDLLLGPFESEDDGSIAVGEEKAQRLFWLVRGGACLQKDQTWEATRDGFMAILQLIRGSTDEGISPPDSEKKLMLATQLFFLFGLLGVFDSQWPEYVLQTSLSHVTALIPMLPSNPKQQFELGEIASTLRVLGRANLCLERYGSQLQHYGSRWQLPVTQCVHASHRGSQLALFKRVCAARADLFLRAQVTERPPSSSSAAEGSCTNAGDANALIHVASQTSG